MAKFKLIGGQHREDGRKYDRGDTVNSERDLVKLFPGKFEKVASVAKVVEAPAEDEDETLDKVPLAPAEESPETEEAAADAPKEKKAKKAKKPKAEDDWKD